MTEVLKVVQAGLFLVIFLSGPVGPAPQNLSGPGKETAGPVLCSPIVAFYSGWHVSYTKNSCQSLSLHFPFRSNHFKYETDIAIMGFPESEGKKVKERRVALKLLMTVRSI